MASIIKCSINLDKIDKSKIIVGEKGKYLPVTIHLNDEASQFGNQGYIIIEQSTEERKSKVDRIYLGYIKVAWTNGENVGVAPKDGQQQSTPELKDATVEDDDLPF